MHYRTQQASQLKPKTAFWSKKHGFTLAELLVSLLILAEIATFTIPKILSTQQNQTYNARIKEDIATIAAAYQQAQLAGTVSSATMSRDLTAYLNYLQLDTSSTIDGLYNWASGFNCSVGNPCIVMHNGSLIWPYPVSFSGTASNNALVFLVDPDSGNSSTSTTGPGKSMEIILYYNGRITTRGNASPTAVSSDQSRSAWPAADPPWFTL